jgi:arginase family enzyme
VNARTLGLDGSFSSQAQLFGRQPDHSLHLGSWGPRLRMACSFGRFKQFEAAMAAALGSASDTEPSLTFIGSGDFHHVSLALLRRIHRPFNLLVIDNHPDWMRGVPFLHCGTWVRHALDLSQANTIYHVGGDVDFDNAYRHLAPWKALRTGRIKVISAVRQFRRGRWRALPNDVLRLRRDEPASRERVDALVDPLRPQLARFPLYISLDKDVMHAGEATVNWDSGHLQSSEILDVLGAFVDATGRRLAGMDVVGDWSPVRIRGMARKFLHWTEHPRLSINGANAAKHNQPLNLVLLERLRAWAGNAPAANANPAALPGDI